jgi:hypothetical protein
VSQPPPKPNTNPAVWDLVIADMHARDRVGRERYGTPLQAHNGRDALRDAYEEALDLAVYLRQAIAERDAWPLTLDAAAMICGIAVPRGPMPTASGGDVSYECSICAGLMSRCPSHQESP